MFESLAEYPVLHTAVITMLVLLFGFPAVTKLLRILCCYEIMPEQMAKVYTLFGNVELVLKEPGFIFLWPRLGVKSILVGLFGRVYTVDLRMDQEYLRSLAVNSGEGAPMGIGVWYEMGISDPLAYLFKNSNPKSSLSTSVSNSTVKCLSNLPLGQMLTDRHTMSRAVRTELHDEAGEWGFKLGSVYIRKVHFRDQQMIKQIESKVVNRLRQFTSAIKQDGANQVNIIRNSAEKEAAVEFARAGAVRPRIVGQVLEEIGADPEIAEVLFEVLETQKMIESGANITLVPAGKGESVLLAANEIASR